MRETTGSDFQQRSQKIWVFESQIRVGWVLGNCDLYRINRKAWGWGWGVEMELGHPALFQFTLIILHIVSTHGCDHASYSVLLTVSCLIYILQRLCCLWATMFMVGKDSKFVLFHHRLGKTRHPDWRRFCFQHTMNAPMHCWTFWCLNFSHLSSTRPFVSIERCGQMFGKSSFLHI